MSTSTNSAWPHDFDPDEVRAVWNGRLVTVEHVSSRVSAPTRWFLAEVGLPADPDLPEMIFVHDDRLSGTASYRGREFLVITDAGSPIGLAIDLASDHVHEFDDKAAMAGRLFNSNVAALVYFVGLLNREVLTLQEQPETILVPAVERIWSELARRDPAALKGESPWKAWLDDLGSQYE